MSSSFIEIRPVDDAAARKAFMRMPHRLYQDDPNYVAPLEFELSARLNAEKNPALKSSPHQLWIAYRNGEPVGRISALVNKDHLERYNDKTGHFGFIEGEDDPEVFKALFETASDWLRNEGMEHIAGPFNFSVNEECGLHVDGYDMPPFIMMPHGRPYYQAQLEALGFQKETDMLAFSWVPKKEFIPAKRMRFVEKALDKPEVMIRNLKASDLLNEMRIIIDIYNDAWSDNTGFIPFGEDHARHMASELRPIIQEHNVVLCYLKGEPVAFGLVLPNINRIIADFNGKLLPFNWAKFLWRLKVKGVDQSRMPLMGVRKKLHGKPVGAAFAYKIIEMVNSANIDSGVTFSECSWILENNEGMANMLLDMGCNIYKRYRIYKKPL